MENNKPTLEQLSELEKLKAEKDQKESEEYIRVQKCLKLNICPECGEQLHTKTNYKQYHNNIFRFLNIRFISYYLWDRFTYCTKDKNHYSELEDDDFYGY